MFEPIRVLHVLGALNRGGAETMIMNLYRNIDREKVQFDFIIHTNKKCDYDDEIKSLGGKIYSIPQYMGTNHNEYKKAWGLFFSKHPEHKVIHGHVRSTASIYLKIAKKNGLVTIAHSHSTASRGNKIQQIVKNILQLPLRYTADYLFACSDEAGKWLFGKRSIKKPNYKLIKNAIDAQKYIFDQPTRNKQRKILGIEDKFVIGHVGSFTYPKNHKFLIEVFNEIRKQDVEVVLLLIGNGELRSQIEKQIMKLGLENNIKLIGSVSNVNDYLQLMDVVVFPSLFEGLPVTLVEAQASGLPCVVSDEITEEVKVTDLIDFLSLDRSVSDWAKKVLEYSHGFKRENKYSKIIDSGYDISLVVKWYEDFYITGKY